MISIITGLVAGLVHVFSGPDHLAAVAPLSVEKRHAGAWQLGARWGIGHSFGVIVVGLLSLMLREVLPLEALSSWAERLVGVVLIGIGIWGIRKGLTNHVHAHEHVHDGEHHLHVHVHSHATAHAHAEPATHTHTHAAFAIGTLHGLAGSSHFLGVLPALAFPTQTQAIGYLAAYGVGTIAAMAFFSGVVGWLACGLRSGASMAYRTLTFACSAAALVIGGYWLVG